MKTTEKNLIIKMLGGSEPGKLMPIDAEQCLLGVDPQCAIIRTPDGVQVQSSKGQLLVNDIETKAKWLSKGDVVQLGNSVFKIEDLGFVPTESNDGGNSDTQQITASEDCDTVDSCSFESEETTEFVEQSTHGFVQSNNSSSSERVSNLENTFKEQHEVMEERFNVISVQLESLCDHLLDFEERLSDQIAATENITKSADQAIKSAEQAITSADQAITSADDAIKSADDAKKTADSAINSADQANKSAQAALETANLANESIANVVITSSQDQSSFDETASISAPESSVQTTDDTESFAIEESNSASDQPPASDQPSANHPLPETAELLMTNEQPIDQSIASQDEFTLDGQSLFQETDVIETFQEATQTDVVTPIVDDAPTSELEEDLGLGSLLDSLREEVSLNEPQSEIAENTSSLADAEQGLEDLESRISAGEASLFEKPAEEAPAENKDDSVHEELASVFKSLEDETDSTNIEQSPSDQSSSAVEPIVETPVFAEPESPAIEPETFATPDVLATPEAFVTPEVLEDTLATPETPTTPAPATTEEAESVAEVLARMGVQPDLEEDTTSSIGVFEDSPQPESLVAPEPTVAAPAAGLAESESSDEPPVGGGEVDDYMSALLTRLKQGPDAEPAPAPKAAPKAQTNATTGVTAPTNAAPVVQQPKLTQEEFVPKSVAPERTNTIAKMRELANQSVSTAVETSDVNRNREKKLVLQIGSLLGLLTGIVLFICSHRVFDLFFLGGILGAAAGVLCLYLLYGKKKTTPKYNKVAAADQEAQPQPQQTSV